MLSVFLPFDNTPKVTLFLQVPSGIAIESDNTANSCLFVSIFMLVENLYSQIIPICVFVCASLSYEFDQGHLQGGKQGTKD